VIEWGSRSPPKFTVLTSRVYQQEKAFNEHAEKTTTAHVRRRFFSGQNEELKAKDHKALNADQIGKICAEHSVRKELASLRHES